MKKKMKLLGNLGIIPVQHIVFTAPSVLQKLQGFNRNEYLGRRYINGLYNFYDLLVPQ